MKTVSEVIGDDHLQNLKGGVRPLSQGESVMRLLQQDRKKQEANELLLELLPGIGRPLGNFHSNGDALLL